MIVSIQGQKRELLIQTVALSKNLDNPDNLYLFRCPYCSTGISQIQGIISNISPGLFPRDDIVALHQCRECKRLYTFQTLVPTNKKNTRVTLISVPHTLGVFHCWICRNPLVQFMDGHVLALPKLALVKLPFLTHCVNPACQTAYHIVDMV